MAAQSPHQLCTLCYYTNTLTIITITITISYGYRLAAIFSMTSPSSPAATALACTTNIGMPTLSIFSKDLYSSPHALAGAAGGASGAGGGAGAPAGAETGSADGAEVGAAVGAATGAAGACMSCSMGTELSLASSTASTTSMSVIFDDSLDIFFSIDSVKALKKMEVETMKLLIRARDFSTGTALIWKSTNSMSHQQTKHRLGHKTTIGTLTLLLSTKFIVELRLKAFFPRSG